MSEHNRAIAAHLVQTTNSQGWTLILQIGEQEVKNLEQKALLCDDESQVIALTRRARGAREFFDAFITTINTLKDPTSNEFVEVTY